MSNFSPAPVAHWAPPTPLGPLRIHSRGPRTCHQLPIERRENASQRVPSYLQRVGHREAHQAGTEAVPGDHGEQGGEQDDAVAHTLQSHGQPPAPRHTGRWRYAHARGQLFRGLAPRRGTLLPEITLDPSRENLLCPACGTRGRPADGHDLSNPHSAANPRH